MMISIPRLFAFVSLLVLTRTESMEEQISIPPTIAPSVSFAPSSSPTAGFVDYFSPSCSALIDISNAFLNFLGLSNPFAYYSCLRETLAKAFQQEGFCEEDDIETIITNSSSTTNCSSFDDIFDRLSVFNLKNLTDDSIFTVAQELFEELMDESSPPIEVDVEDWFNQSLSVFDAVEIRNTTDPDKFGCYIQNIFQEFGASVMFQISDPSCLLARVEQVHETYIAFYRVENFNSTVQLYIVIASGIGFLLLLFCGALALSISSSEIGKDSKR